LRHHGYHYSAFSAVPDLAFIIKFRQMEPKCVQTLPSMGAALKSCNASFLDEEATGPSLSHDHLA
jgi:hypothetical protein